MPRTVDGRRRLLVGLDATGDQHPSAKKMFGLSQHHHHRATVGQRQYRRGHCWVTLWLLTHSRREYVRRFAINIALYIARQSCAAAQYKSKPELATAMLDKLAQWLGGQ